MGVGAGTDCPCVSETHKSVSLSPAIFLFPSVPSPQAQVAFLQGERKGQENLKTDLVRRIKMLEYALKQERCARVPLALPSESRSPVAQSGDWGSGILPITGTVWF